MAELSDIFPINIWFHISCFDENVFQTLTKTSKIFRQFASKNKHLVYKEFGNVQPIDKNEECDIGFKWVLFGKPNRLGHLPIKLGDIKTCWNVRYGKPSSVGRRGRMRIEYGDRNVLIGEYGEYTYINNCGIHVFYNNDSTGGWYCGRSGSKLPDYIGGAGISWNYWERDCRKSIYVSGGMYFRDPKNNAPEKLRKNGTFE